jgi:hypothetical protein
MKRHPFASTMVMAVAVTAVAGLVGAAEVALGATAAFAAYKVLREGEPVMAPYSNPRVRPLVGNRGGVR